PVEKLAGVAQDASTDPQLAALTAVLAYRLTPYDADDGAHPAVYNALWLALERLDENAAAKLVAPRAKPKAGAKIGTTSSAQLVKVLCSRVTRALTQEEWASLLPADAPYSKRAANPCS